jgi:hypothetical protein
MEFKMQAIIQANETFQYTADLHKVEAIPGTFSLTISSTFTGDKTPAPRQVFKSTLNQAGLLAPRDLIDTEVSSSQ